MEKNEKEATPDKVSYHKFGYIEGGDGLLYRVARGGLNARGQLIDDLYEKIIELAKEGGDRSETYNTAKEFFRLAFEPFYNSERIDKLIDGGVFVWSDIPDVTKVVSGDNVIEDLKKKES